MMKLGKRTFLVLCVLSAVDCTIISNVNSIFEVFSPKSMVRFFEFNDFGWNITGECVKVLIKIKYCLLNKYKMSLLRY